jgi:hypothetical protein
LFGVNALSQQPHATQGFVNVASQTMSGDFSQTSQPIKITSSISELSGNFRQSAAANGVVPGEVSNVSFNFTQTTDPTLINITGVDYTSEFTQTADPNRIASGDADVSANFVQSVAPNFTASGEYNPTFQFDQTTTAAKTTSGLSTQRTDSVQTTPTSVRRHGDSDMSFTFTQDSEGVRLKLGVLGELVINFEQDTFGENLFEDWADLVPTATEVWSVSARGTGIWTPRSTVSNATWTTPVR